MMSEMSLFSSVKPRRFDQVNSLESEELDPLWEGAGFNGVREELLNLLKEEGHAAVLILKYCKMVMLLDNYS